MLVTRFMNGLTEEIRAAIVVQLPDTVQQASAIALMQESVLASRATKALKGKFVKLPQYKSDVSSDTTPGRVDKGDLWKAKQLKDYRRAQDLCFKCGDKYTPEHRCAIGGQSKLCSWKRCSLMTYWMLLLLQNNLMMRRTVIFL